MQNLLKTNIKRVRNISFSESFAYVRTDPKAKVLGKHHNLPNTNSVWPMLPFYAPWKHQKPKIIVLFSGGAKLVTNGLIQAVSVVVINLSNVSFKKLNWIHNDNFMVGNFNFKKSGFVAAAYYHGKRHFWMSVLVVAPYLLTLIKCCISFVYVFICFPASNCLFKVATEA